MDNEQNVCMFHSGQCEAIETLKKNDTDIFTRLHEVEKAVWKTSAITGITTGLITAVVITILQKLIK